MAKVANNMKNVLLWLPRLLVIAYILFLSIFAFDAFSADSTVLENILGLIMHLVPSFILMLVLFVAWKNEKLGAVLFAILGVIFTIFFNSYRELVTFAIISLPLFAISSALLLSHYFRNKEVSD